MARNHIDKRGLQIGPRSEKFSACVKYYDANDTIFILEKPRCWRIRVPESPRNLTIAALLLASGMLMQLRSVDVNPSEESLMAPPDG